MNPFSYFRDRHAVFDGGMGTMLQQKGLKAGALPETMNFDAPDAVTEIHEKYIKAGADIISTNSFGANELKLDGTGLDPDKTVEKAVLLARAAADKADRRVFVAADFGPTGKLFAPSGELTFEDACNAFGRAAKAAEKAGADLIFFETMSDLYECKAAVLGARESCSLPIAVSVTFDETGHTLTGADADCVCVYLCGLGADAIGINCGLGPDLMEPIAKKLAAISTVPVIVNANAGLPVIENGKTVFKVGAERFFEFASSLCDHGVFAVGGCCGTTPLHISAVAEALKNKPYCGPKQTVLSAVCSGSRAFFFGNKTAVIGERLNPTGKPKLKEALKTGNTDYICREAVSQEQSGANLLDINTGLPGIDESAAMVTSIRAAQSVSTLPLVLDSANPAVLENAIRIYDGIPVVNSVNGKKESMEQVLPLIKKYGGMPVCLLLDENGIPETAAGRLEIADRILSSAEEHGIPKEKLVFDALTMTVATDKKNGDTTLECVEKLTKAGLFTVLGVSNISFGLPNRDRVNAMFLGAAINRGLSAAIINPASECAKTVLADPKSCGDFSVEEIEFDSAPADPAKRSELTLYEAVFCGLSDSASELTAELLKTLSPLEIIESRLIPALNALGDGYGKKQLFLPRLLGGASAAKAAFSVLNSELSKNSSAKKGMDIVVATVQGDIHDIGKNIVATLLSNYGFSVTDLGKDVSPQTVVETVKSINAPLVSLSALMTTTVPAMEETVRLLKQECPACKVMVGGAVLTKEYARSMGADFYGEDAISAVRYAMTVKA